jgi:putative ABC transport system permease protein
MIKNYFKIALRNLLRNKAFSFINIVGLATGLATCLLIMLYILDENNYDKHHKDGDRIYRIASFSAVKSNAKGETWAALAAPMAAAIESELPEVEQATRLMTFPDIATMLLKYQNQDKTKSFFENNGYYVDSNFLQVFSYDFIFGNGAKALNQPNTVVIADVLSEKFFGKENPVGKALLITTPFGEFNYTIKAVFNSHVKKTHIPANYFLSMRNNDMWNWVQRQTSWVSNNIFFTYIKARPGVNEKNFEQKLNAFFDRHAGADMKAAGFEKNLFLQPLKDIYLRSNIGNEIAPNGNGTYLYILGSIGAFILLIACINFMNLSTARSQQRAREVGIRKVMGAVRASLVRQFLGESFLVCLIALLLAFVIAGAILPVFNSLANKQMHFFDDLSVVYWITGLALFTGLLAGLYPAFYLSSFKPVTVLKGKLVNSFSAAAIRKGLVVFQFTISICLILGAIVIWKQLDLLKNQPLGFNKEQKLVLPLQKGYKNSEHDYTALRNELLKNPAIASVTAGSAYPGVANLNDMLFYAEGKSTNDVVDVHLAAIESDYIQTLGFALSGGRSFLKNSKADSADIILNETAVKQLGYTVANAVGKKIMYNINGNRGSMEIVGIVKDFNFESLHTGIQAFGFTDGIFAGKYGYLIASVKTGNYAGLLKEVGKIWTGLNPATPFEYSFIDQDFQRNYEKETRTASVIASFTIIAVLIACLGLFGLAAFSAEQRTKEIGVRKVLGASIMDVAALLSAGFVKLILMALVIASPIAWYCMNRWLQGFAYQTTVSWWMFAIAGSLAVLIALITTSFQAIKAAITNPVKSLRSE